MYEYSVVDRNTGVGERHNLLRKVRHLHGYISQCSYLPSPPHNKELHKLYLLHGKLLSTFFKIS
jgi:hypothetical protein